MSSPETGHRIRGAFVSIRNILQQMFLDVSIVYVRAYDECLNIGIWPTMSGNEASERCFAELVTSVEMDWPSISSFVFSFSFIGTIRTFIPFFLEYYCSLIQDNFIVIYPKRELIICTGKSDSAYVVNSRPLSISKQ